MPSGAPTAASAVTSCAGEGAASAPISYWLRRSWRVSADVVAPDWGAGMRAPSLPPGDGTGSFMVFLVV